MARRRSSGSILSRRRVVSGLGAGLVATGAGLVPTGAFSSARGDRDTAIGVEDDRNGYVGLDVASSVTKNKVSDLVTVTNNRPETISVTVSLTNGDGGATSDLYLGGSNVGDSVTFSVAPGNGRSVQVETSLNGGSVLDFAVAATSPEFDFSAARTTDVVTGNDANAVKINSLSDLTADPTADEFTVGKAMGKDDDGDADVDHATFTVFDSGGSQVGETTDASHVSGGGSEYKITGGESLTFGASADVVAGETYTFRFRLEDADGNYATAYADVTA